MAPPKATPPGPVIPNTRRPLNALFLLFFASFSGALLYLMRLEPVAEGVPAGFRPAIETGALPNGTPLVARFTGVRALDGAARFLVAAFLEGTAGWDAGVRLQQVYFLLNWFAVVCVWAVESSRPRNAGRLISFVSLFSLLYQFIGAGIIAPLYYLAYVYTSRDDAYYFHGRELPAGYAVSLLPAAVVGYIVPTIAMYYPWADVTMTQYATAFWQPSPLYVSALLLVFSFLVPSAGSPSAVAKNSDVRHLKRVYLVAGVVSAVAHFATVYVCLTSDDPRLSLGYVFLPNKLSRNDSLGMGLHYIFQWDFWGAFGSTLCWLWLTTFDVLRILGKPTAKHYIQTVLGLVITTLIAGPGTTIALSWSWREDRLLMMESGVRGTWQKPKAA